MAAIRSSMRIGRLIRRPSRESGRDAMRATVVLQRAIVNNRSGAVRLHFLYVSRVFVAIGLGNRNAIPI
jgi:hypothetical protein